MTAPNLPAQFPLPSNGGQPMTYAELLRQLSCVCTAGVQIKPTVPPSAAIDLGDVIADFSKYLTAFTAPYSVLTIVMQVIACIIDVLCAIPNPFAIVRAMIRLFGTCIPEFVLIFPQFAIPAKVLCVLKVIIAILRFVLEVIVPLIEDLIQNIEILKAAIEDGNEDAKAAAVFKIIQHIKEMYNIVEIIAALEALIIMIKALISAGISIPCGGSGGSCSGCGDDQCPSVIKQYAIDGTDGIMYILYYSSGIEYRLRFASSSKRSSFLTLRDFFPNIDYASIDDLDKVPYVLEVGAGSQMRSFAVTSVDRSGTLNIRQIENAYAEDGYMSSVYNHMGVATPVPNPDDQVRFGTSIRTFHEVGIDDYLEISDTNASGSELNSGTFKVNLVYDDYNARIERTDGNGWSADATLDPSGGTGPGDLLVWRTALTAPSFSGPQQFSLKIDHELLIKHNLIGSGCHPEVSAAVEGISSRFPFVTSISLPELPSGIDVNDDGTVALMQSCISCLSTIAPSDLDEQYVLDNYNVMAQEAASSAACLESALSSAADDLSEYAEGVYPRLFSSEQSTLSSNRVVQYIGGDVEITITALDHSGNSINETVPEGMVDAEIFTTFGNVGEVEEVVGDDGLPTGEYKATLTSAEAGMAEVTGSVAGIFVSDFDETPLDRTPPEPPVLVPRSLEIRFVEPPEQRRKHPEELGEGAGSAEPLGIAKTRS